MANTAGRLYVMISGVKVLHDGAAEDLTRPFWIRWAIDLAKVDADLTGVTSLTIGVDNGGSGMLLFDDIRSYRVAPAVATEEVWTEAEAADSLVWPMQVYSDRLDDCQAASISRGKQIADQQSADRADWTGPDRRRYLPGEAAANGI